MQRERERERSVNGNRHIIDMSSPRRPPARDRWISSLEPLLQPGMSGTITLTADQTVDIAELHEWLLRHPRPDPELDGEDGPIVDITSPVMQNGDAQDQREWAADEDSLSDVVGPPPPPQSQPPKRRIFAHHSFPRGSMCASVPRALLDGAEMGDVTSAYLASEYGGVQISRANELINMLKTATRAQMLIANMQLSMQLEKSLNESAEDFPSETKSNKMYIPPEWYRLDGQAKRKLHCMLEWDILRRWGDGFNIFDVAETCGGAPLLFVGWAILASPFAQAAMASDPDVRGSVSDRSEDEAVVVDVENDNDEADGRASELGGGYNFVEKFSLPPRVLCNFLRSIEGDYSKTIDYHTNIHAADVLQTTHCLLEMGGNAYVSGPLQSFTLLLSAAIHDVGHPGRNNAFQVRQRADPAITYNDRNVLENLHLSLAFGRLLGIGRDECLDILAGLDREQVDQVRSDAVAAVLDTDFSRHFDVRQDLGAQVEELRQKAAESAGTDGGDGDVAAPDVWRLVDQGEPAKMVLRFLLHMADISGQAKPAPLFTEWSSRVYAEFFAQGDDEERLGLPISPLCNRKTTDEAKSQVGYLEFIVKPAFELLGKLVPRVAEEVLPIVEDNLAHWQRKCEEPPTPSASAVEPPQRCHDNVASVA